jgi:membrane associated rhomboid family serine protease
LRRGRFGASAFDAPRFGLGLDLTPVVRRLLIANFAVWGLQLVFAWVGTDALTEHFAFHSDRAVPWRPWQFVTYMFLHSAPPGPWHPFHLLLNMLMLAVFGGPVERWLGSRRFLRYYLICGAAGAMLSLLPPFRGTTLGASGAVLGVLTAFGLLFPDTPVYMLFFFFPIPAKVLVLFLALLNLMAVAGSLQDGTSYIAHLGGMAAGYVMLRGLPVGRRLRRRWQAHSEARRLARRAELRTSIDAILDKLHREGKDSLTREEWNALLEESRRMHGR